MYSEANRDGLQKFDERKESAFYRDVSESRKNSFIRSEMVREEKLKYKKKTS